MPVTIREYLGDEKIAQLEGMGFLPNLIADMAKRQYMQDRQAKRNELADSGLDGKLVQGIMRGDVSEEEARNAQKFEDFGAKKHGWGLGAAKTVAGIANAAERVSDFINPFYEGQRDEKGNYVYQNAIEKGLRPKIKSAEKLRDDYEKATGETSWGSRAAEIGTEMVADPINFVGGMGLLSKGSKLAQFGKKSLFFAGTGAASGGVMALGEGKNDEETLKNMGYGAAGGFVLGHAIDQGIQGIGKLIAKRRASKAANEADAVSQAENSEFIGGDGGAGAGGIKAAEVNFDGPDDQTMATIVVRDTLKKESLAVREKVLEEIARGAEKSSVISPEKYKNILNGINEYKAYYDILKHARDNPNEVKNAELVFNQMQENFAKANNDNVKKYYDAAAAFGKKSNIAETMTAREFATKEAGLDEATAAKVVKEAVQGKEKSDFVDADTYADIVKFKNFENQRDYARSYGEQIEAAKQSLERAREQSAVRYADTQRAINEYQKQGMSASATKELINAKFKPGADEINYTRAYNDGADVDPRLAGQGIFYAIEKDIALGKYTPEQYFARLESKGYGDEQATVLTQAYVKKDINIAKDYANNKAAEVYENNIRAQVASEIKAKNEAEGEGWTMKDGGAAKTDYVIKTDLSPNARDLSKITTDEISADLEYLAGKHPEIFDKPSDVFRLVKDIKENPTHFFTNNRLDYALIVKRLKNNKIGKLAIDKQSGEVKHATKVKDKDLKRLAKVSEEKSGNAGIIQTFTRPGSKLENQGLGYQDETIISQKGNLVNEKEANGLRDSVSSIGDNASRAGGRQAGDEQILRQGRRDITNASQTKRPAQSDEQVEQQWAAKADGEADAAAATKQVVEKQGSGASIGGGVAANSNAHLGSGLVAGTLNSVDEDGNFSPERFAAGFLAGLAGGKAVATGLRKMTPKLYNQILGAAEKMPQMANGNPRLLGKLYSNGKDVSLNSFAGEKAITANVGKLDQAKAMLEKGADEVEIWQKAGWFKDKDGAWKFEIGDSNTKLNPGFQSGGRLGELLDHEELFKAYPELKDVRVVKIGDQTPDGATLSVKDAAQREKRGIYNVAFNNKKSTIIRKDLDVIDEIIKFEKGEADYMAHGERKSGYGALHIQKHLDTQNNGWVTKQEYLNMGQMLRKSTMKEADDKRIYTYFNDEGVRFRVVIGIGKNKERVISFYSNRKPLKAGLSYNSQNYDGNLPLNDDIIAQNGTKGYYSPANNEIGLSDLGDKSTLIHEVQHAIQEIEDFARGSGAKDESYRLSHGEAEARNVQNRLNLDGKAHPHETFDINPNETIVSKDGEVSYSRKIEEIKREHPNVEKELDDSIAAMRRESFNDSNFKNGLLKTIDDFIAETKGHPASGDLARPRSLATQELGKSVNLSDKQLAVLKNDIKNADFKVISDSKIYFDKIGKDGDKKRFFVDIAQDGSLRVDAYAKSQIDNIPVKQSALEELAGTGDAARLKGMSFEVKAAYRNELDPIKKEAILKTAEYNALKKEMRGIYNVINNSKESTNVYKDLQKIDDAIKLEQGSKKKGGAVHVQKHLDPSAKGAVTQQEVMGIGKSVREYIKKYKEPFVDKDGGKIYEWQDKDGVRFRVAVYDKIKKSVGAGSTTRITTTDAYESIITFYSDRNLNGRMDFLDPRLRAEAKFEEFKAKNLDENGNIKDGLSLC